MKKHCIRKGRIGDIFRYSIFGFRHSTHRGMAVILVAFFFLVISLTVGLGVVHPVINQVESVRSVERGALSLYAAEGTSQDVVYRLMKGMSVDAVETLSFGMATGTATTTTVLGGKEVVASGDKDRFIRKSKAHLASGEGVAFNYGVQVGTGGIILENSSSIIGNVYSSGTVDGAGSNLIQGDVISAGSSGLVKDIHATSSVYAHTIQNSTIDKNAYYQSISGSTVLGTLYPGSPDQATTSLPTSDAQITEWENDAVAGGVISSPCSYSITTSVTIGPKKINCDLEISGSPTVTLAGPLWVAGNIGIQNSATVRVDPSFGEKSVVVVAHKPSDETGSGTIQIGNTVVIQGSGSASSYIMFVSQNKSAEQGGGTKAIVVQNSAQGKMLLYAPHGEIEIQNSAKLKEVTGWRVRLKNSAQVLYESGLASLLFSAGPSGGYTFDKWREVE